MLPVGMTIGFIGIGVMGNSMASHLLAAGHKLHVYTRTASKAAALIQAGAKAFSSPAELAAGCDAIITMVGYPSDVEEVYFGPKGLLGAAAPGTLLIDMTTSSPGLAARIYSAAKEKGLDSLDAPVSGGDIGARNATLTIMAGGDQAAFERARPILALMGKTIILQGAAGAGQHTKSANQICVAANLMGTVEAFRYAAAAGLDPRRVLESIGGGSAGSWQLSSNGPRMLDGNFAPGFYVKHFLKDLRIALDSAKAMKLNLPLLALAESLFEKVSASGLDEEGTQVLYRWYEAGLA